MADIEDHPSPIVDDPSRLRCCKPSRTRTILHGVMVTALLFVIMFGYMDHLNRLQHIVSLVIELIAYFALACLYICNSSGWQEKFISAGYLVIVQLVFIISSIGIPADSLRVDFVSGTNLVAISSYCVLKFRFDILHSRLTKTVRAILNVVIVIIILVVIIATYMVDISSYHGLYHSDQPSAPLLIQLVAYNAVGCLYICNSSSREEKIISAGFLVFVLLVILLSSFAKIVLRPSLIFWANIVAISLFSCVLTLLKIYPCLRGRFLPDADAAPPRQKAVLLLESPFRIKGIPREFSSDELQSITQDFGNRIGHGASAQVFRGNLDDGTAVAVKRIHMHSGRTEAGEEEFRREVSIIANVHHRSLVRLLGYCLHHLQDGGGGGLYLVYPFFENGSLDRWLFHGSVEQRRLLTWPKRRWIAVDVARALAYLHSECHRRILHLDVKPGNILLDGDLRAHVSDFGISLSITRGLTSVINTRGRGTFGYMAPEMLVNAVSDRSDVFSYGMTLLELIGGRRNFDPSSSATPDPNLARNLREKMAQGEHMELVDAAMEVAVDDVEAVKTVLMVALCCIQHERDMRPTMQNVVDMLEGRVAVDLPPEARHPSSSALNLSEPHSISEHAVSDVHGG